MQPVDDRRGVILDGVGHRQAPRKSPSQPATTAVLPADSSARARSSRSSARIRPASASSLRRPTQTMTPSTSVRTRCPASASSLPAGRVSSRDRAAVVMAWPMGCSLSASTAPTRRCSSSSVVAAAWTSVSDIRPVVRVPVLSNTTVVMVRIRSSTSTPLMRMPMFAPRPVPTMIADGVARPRAQGHAMISTATAATSPPMRLTLAGLGVGHQLDDLSSSACRFGSRK